MGEAELLYPKRQLIIHSDFIFYGDAASPELASQIADDIRQKWMEPAASIRRNWKYFDVLFEINGFFDPEISPETIWYNTEPHLNFFRIEEFSQQHVSFVDGLGCNTGYFKLDNLLNNSATAAHEYGHTLGLNHPAKLDIRNKGQPGIMYPRGTICDPSFQYDPQAQPLQPGGTLNPHFRKVLQKDIDDLKLSRLAFNAKGRATVGGFSSIFHEKHSPLLVL